MSRRKKRRNSGEVANWMLIPGQSFLHGLVCAFGLAEIGQSSVPRTAVTKVQSRVNVLRKSTTHAQILVCPDIICKVLDMVSGAYLVLGKPWPSSQNHLRHRDEAV